MLGDYVLALVVYVIDNYLILFYVWVSRPVCNTHARLEVTSVIFLIN